MVKFFSNKWTKRVVSLLSPVYTALVLIFAYFSIFYTLEVRDPKQVCLMLSAVSLFALVIMLYTRETLLTKLCSLLLLPAMVLPVLCFFGQWEVLIPPFVVALIIFFFSGLGETAKTIWGTIFLLIYLIGSLIYFMATSMFAPSTVTTTVQSGLSPSGIYRYQVTETIDSSNGATKVTVETTALDRDYDLVVFKIKGLYKDVKIERPLNEDVTIEWTTEDRQDITKQLLSISRDIEVTLSDKQMDALGRDAYEVTYPDGLVQTYTATDFHQIIIPLSQDDQEFLKVDEPEIRLDKIGERGLAHMGMAVSNFRTVKLSSLTDQDLATLGIPAQGDVMYYNGKCVFRYYIAILEEFFDISNQDLSLF